MKAGALIDDGPALALLAFGVPLIVLAGVLAWNQVAAMEGTITATGRVASIRTIQGHDRRGNVVPERAMHAPMVAFRTPDGPVMHVASHDYARTPCCAVGDVVRLRLRLDAPDQLRIVSLRDEWLWPGMAALLGLVLTSAGVVVLRRNRRLRALR